MAVARGVIQKIDEFDHPGTITTTPQFEFGWTKHETKTAGSPSIAMVADTVSGSAVKLLLDNTNETQVETLDQNDLLPLLLAELQFIEMVCKVSGIASHTTALFGIATAENDTPASVSNYAWFKILGSTSTSELYIDTSDGTNTNTTVDTGTTLASVYKKCVIDFTFGLKDVRFYVDGARVAAGTTFNMSAASATQGVQVYFQIQKTNTDAPALFCDRVKVQYRYAVGQ